MLSLRSSWARGWQLSPAYPAPPCESATDPPQLPDKSLVRPVERVLKSPVQTAHLQEFNVGKFQHREHISHRAPGRYSYHRGTPRWRAPRCPASPAYVVAIFASRYANVSP